MKSEESRAPAHFRAHGRRRVELRATLRDRARTLACRVALRDLGLGGASIEIRGLDLGSAGELTRGTAVSLEIMAPTLWDPLVLRGRIAWAVAEPDRLRAGIGFEHRDPAAAFALFQLLGAQDYGL